MVVLRTKGVRRSLTLVLVLLLLLGAPAGACAAGLAARFERTLGAGTAPTLIKEYGGEYILPIQQRLWVEEVFRRVAAQSEREDVEYTLTVLNSKEANAFSLPGGFIFITRGLLSLIGSDEAQLAAVLGHEIAHVEKKHGVNAVLRQMGLSVLAEVGVAAIDFLSAELLRLAGLTLVQMLQAGWGREAELEADALGQELAARAGFDPAGGIALLDALAQADSADQPMHLFRTHPEPGQRRKILEEKLALFWSEPVEVTSWEVLERLKQGRNSHTGGRSDPKGRYVLEELGEPSLGVRLFDQQIQGHVTWVEEALVRNAAWSPQGEHLALLVEGKVQREVWILNRWGAVVKRLQVPQGTVTAFSWAPQGSLLALEVEGPAGRAVAALHVQMEALALVSRGLEAQEALWLDGALYFRHGESWYSTRPPQMRPVQVAEPVPVVLQRQRVLTPTLIREGNTFRLTRPELTPP
mgnify:FL=1